jgi:hypothetical protein
MQEKCTLYRPYWAIEVFLRVIRDGNAAEDDALIMCVASNLPVPRSRLRPRIKC